MNRLIKTSLKSSQSGAIGCGAMIGVALIILILLLVGSNEGIGYYLTHCQEEDFFACMSNQIKEDPEPESGVTATGTYTYKDYSATLTLNIPLDGGEVSGVVSGTCEGRITGSYDGENNGVISGKMLGACSPFIVNIPASGEFNGTVNKDSKAVPINVSGRGGGFSKQDVMTLSY